ncbi:TPA: phage repressor protein CI [Yersinia enterocolitica]|uniref:phage repressor protein CI n=1 Tax=Yersinia enterocolitica TaxID=630 RepID=UPI0005FCDFDE|nr:phage repressor protein CI [Yersinia enterocolitica]EKN5932275.1 phage repressor protein CI [Yersinia enterocolitica]ELX2275050.1 phage repressor protein CI [Yersinia enterocolitica]ELY5259875.1 phage repressor protein CI [Yersinia enterocolitica]ELY5261580.1 phage repressor protein CI [Yersinia enterocolitica]CRE74170.1 CI repressor [Yersinia enterocolitica]
MDLTKSHASQIVERLISSYRVSSQKELAECLGIPANTISGWVKRDAVSSSSIIKCALDTGAELPWLLSGKFENSNLKNDKCNISLKGKGLYEQVLQSGGKALLRRILDAYGFSTQKELGDLLGIPTGTISTWIRRDFFPGDVVVTCALDTGVSLEWLATGKRSVFVDNSVAENNLLANNTVIIDKKRLVAGRLEGYEKCVLDKCFIPENMDEHKLCVVYAGKNSWLVNINSTEISNGNWLLDIDGILDIYTVSRRPGNRIRVANSNEEFDCLVDEVKARGIVIVKMTNYL